MKFWSRMSLLAALAAAASLSASPTVDNVRLTQSADRTFTVLYDLSDGPAVVTVDFKIGGVSIGGGRIMADPPTGDVWKKIATGDDRSIVWRPGLACADIASGDVVAEVSAYPTDDPPDYMVVSLAEVAANRVRFYPSAESLPGGVLANEAYRKTDLLMRKIHAKGVTWTMGSFYETSRGTEEHSHPVTLGGNYYMGVFELTQAQAFAIIGTYTTFFTVNREMRPAEQISFARIRHGANNKENTAYDYPEAPGPGSLLDTLRKLVGNAIDFDLPGEAQWEYACRSGRGEGLLNDGTDYATVTYATFPGRHQYTPGSGGRNATATSDPAVEGTAICGSYPPNAWGLYDMHGNVYEWCLDFYKLTSTSPTGAVNTDSSDYTDHVVRGGSWYNPPANCRSASRNNRFGATSTQKYNGVRLYCPAAIR